MQGNEELVQERTKESLQTEGLGLKHWAKESLADFYVLQETVDQIT